MALTQSTEYALSTTPQVIVDKRYREHIPHLIPFNITVPASAGAGQTIALCTVPAGFIPRAVFISNTALSASGGVGLTLNIGDADDDNRLLDAYDADAVNSTFGLIAAGYNYEYTADTVINAVVASNKTPVQGGKLSGFILGSVRM